jgi:pyrroloquinoline quinone biosynthesis protein E
MTEVQPPLAVSLELTHRCPLRCPYCYNPVELIRSGAEMATDEWKRVLDEAAEMGALEVHFSGGEPMVRDDLVELMGHASRAGLYPNLITSAVMLDKARLRALTDAGLEHIQISIQDTQAQAADHIAGMSGAHAKKLAAARLIGEAGIPITLNAVMHRANIDRISEVIDLAVEIGARRLEIAQVQYYGWALKNRAAFIPTRQQLKRATAIATAAMERLKGVLVIDYVVPDYYARRPKSCMGGWGRRFIIITPSGMALPCHAAETVPGLGFDSVRERGLNDIWMNSDAFERFRGTDWMGEPCQSCERREIDWGGCRCQALALTGDASNADPACESSPHHQEVVDLAEAESKAPPPPLVYRGFKGS